MIQSGDKVPSVPVRFIDAEGTREADTLEILGQGHVVFFGVPGAFTPTCDTSHLPGFVSTADKIKAHGVSRIVCGSANDHHVMRAWAEKSGALGRVDFIADPHAAFADALGLAVDRPDLGGRRFQRFAMILKDGVVEQLFVQDVAGVTVSGAPAILMALEAADSSVSA
jgi:glutaredoxin/glutathione-dependent peroxiredoxin